MPVEVGVVDAPFYDNILLGRKWIYSMKVIVSSVFHVMCFLYKDRIVTIDQLSYDNSSSSASPSPTIPIINNSQPTTDYIGFRMYISFVGTFSVLAPILVIDSKPDGVPSPLSPVLFHTAYLSNSLTLPSLCNSDEGPTSTSAKMSLFAMQIAYQSIFDITAFPDPSPLHMGEEDHLVLPA